jgi:hypothetical protein
MKRRLTIGLAASIGAVALACAEATAALQPVNSEPPIM